MKKSFHYIIINLVALLALGSCTHNNGDIGPWFGTWHVEDISSNAGGIIVFADYFFQFQNTTFRVSLVNKENFLVESYGTWQEQDGRLIIDFPDTTAFYISMPGLEEHNVFTVTKTSSREVSLSKTAAAGDNYTYRIRKNP